MAWPAIVVKKIKKIPLIIHVLDQWPISITTGGISKESLPYKILTRWSKNVYNSADLITCSSKSFKNYFINELKSRRKLDIIKGYTTKGIHRDDFMIYINEREVQIYGSQGQNRTAVLSLKLAELNIIKDDIGESPILLLDDFMSELDSNRRKKLLENIKDIQVIITCTEKLVLENLEYFSYNVIDGNVIDENNNNLK